MNKALVMTNKVESRQKGWKLFFFIAGLQILFLIAGYLISIQ